MVWPFTPPAALIALNSSTTIWPYFSPVSVFMRRLAPILMTPADAAADTVSMAPAASATTALLGPNLSFFQSFFMSFTSPSGDGAAAFGAHGADVAEPRSGIAAAEAPALLDYVLTPSPSR